MSSSYIKSLCSQLYSEKITDRKKACDCLKNLLANNKEVHALLTLNNEWENVFHSSQMYFRKEGEKLEKEERSSKSFSRTSVQNREMTKSMATSLIKVVLKLSCKDKPQVRLNSILELIFFILSKEHPYFFQNFAKDAVFIVKNYLINFHQYYSCVSSISWKNIVKECIFSVNNDIDVDLPDVVIVLTGIAKIIKKCPVESNDFLSPAFILKPVLPFLNKQIETFSTKSQNLQYAIVKLMITLCLEYGCQWRETLCKIGEETMYNILSVWSSCPQHTKISLMQYLNIQLILHSPQQNGHYSEIHHFSEGSTFLCNDTWKRQLKQIYQLIYECLTKYQESYQYNSGSFKEVLPVEFITLAARLCCQIFQDHEDVSVIDITQLCSTACNSSANALPASKKRKVEVGFPAVCERLKTEGCSEQSIPWFKILGQIIAEHSLFFENNERIKSLIEVFLIILPLRKSALISKEIYSCVHKMINIKELFKKDKFEDIKIKLTKIAEIILRQVAGKQNIDSGLIIVRDLIECNLIYPQASLYNLIGREVFPLNDPTLRLLLILLKKYNIPKLIRNESYICDKEFTDTRLLLVQLLLPLQSEKDISHIVAVNYCDIVNIFVKLMVQVPSRLIPEHDEIFEYSQNRSESELLEFIQLENMLLKSIFQLELVKTKQMYDIPSICFRSLKDVKILSYVKNFLTSRLNLFIQENFGQEVNLKGSKSMPANLTTPILMFNVIKMMLKLIIQMENDKCLIECFPDLSKLTKWISNYLSTVVANIKENANFDWSTLISLFVELNNFLGVINKMHMKNLVPNIIFQNFLEAFSMNFQKMILNFITEWLNSSASTSNQSTSTQKSRISISNEKTLDFDDSFDESHEIFVSPDEFDSPTLNENSCEVNNEHREEFTVQMLTSKDQTILTLFKTLSLLHEIYFLNESADSLPLNSAIKLFSTNCQSKKCDLVFMTLETVGIIFTSKYNDENVRECINMLTNVFKQNISDSRIAVDVLCRIRDLLKVNGKLLSNDVKTYFIQPFMKSFAEKITNAKCRYGIDVFVRFFECIEQLTRIDPERSWSHFDTDGAENMSEISCLLRVPFYDVRMKSIDALHLMFNRRLSSDVLKNKFENVCRVFSEKWSDDTKIPINLKNDERTFYSSTFLQMLCNVAVSCPTLEHQAVYAIVASVKNNSVDVILAKRALALISQRLNTDLHTYLENRLETILLLWHNEKHPLLEFPYAIFDEATIEAFLGRYCDKITCLLFSTEDAAEEIGRLAAVLNISTKNLIERNFSYMLASVLPFLLAAVLNCAQEQKFSRYKLASSKLKWKWIESQIDSNSLATKIEKNSAEMGVALLRLVHDPASWGENDMITSCVPYYVDKKAAVFALENMHTVFYKDDSPNFIHSLCEKRFPMHSFLHQLFSDIMKNIDDRCDRLRETLTHFEVLVEIVAKFLGPDLVQLQSYLINNIVKILAHVIVSLAHKRTQCHDLFLARYCQVFSNFVNCCTKTTSTIVAISSVLQSVIFKLISLQNILENFTPVFEVLQPIFSSEHELIKKSVAKIAKLPITDPIFMKDLSKTTVEQVKTLFYIQHDLTEQFNLNPDLVCFVRKFLDISRVDVTRYDILELLDSLDERSEEICELYSRKSSNDVILSHGLILRLTNIISNSSNDDENQVKQLSLECLGKLGPVSLKSSVFPIEESDESQKTVNLDCSLDSILNTSVSESENENRVLFTSVFSALENLLLSFELDKMNATVEALQNILLLKECNRFVIDNESLDNAFVPFMPLLKVSKSKRTFKDMELSEFSSKFNGEVFWDIETDFKIFITSLTVTLIECGTGMDFFNYLIPVCKVDSKFCETILPHVFYSVLKLNIKDRRAVLSRFVANALKNVAYVENASYKIKNFKKCLKVILDTVNYFRTKDPPVNFSDRKRITNWERNLWLDIDYLDLAKTALFCDSPFSTIMFCEIACDILVDKMYAEVSNASLLKLRQLSPIQRIASSFSGQAISSLLLQVLSSIGFVDGVEGCVGVSSSLNYEMQTILCRQRDNFIQALKISDISGNDNYLIEELQKNRLHNVVNQITKDKDESSRHKEAWAESSWKLGQWDEVQNSDESAGFNHSFYKSLAALRDNDKETMKNCRDEFYNRMIKLFAESNHECTTSMYKILTDLQIFSEFRDISDFLFDSNEQRKTKNDILNLNSIWDEKESYGIVDNSHKEKICEARIGCLKALLSVHDDKTNIKNLIGDLITRQCAFGDRFSALQTAQSLGILTEKNWSLKLEEVKLSLSLGDTSQSICLLRDHILPKTVDNVNVHPKAQLLYGQVLTKSHTMSPESIIDDIYCDLINTLEENKTIDHHETLIESYHNLATFTDQTYQNIIKNLNSENSKIRKKQIQRSFSELNQKKALLITIKSNKGKNDPEFKEVMKSVAVIERSIDQEENYFQCKELEYETHLHHALENYLKLLQSSGKHDLTVFRVVDLWFENLPSEEVNNYVLKFYSKVPSHKFIPIIYQLVARLSCETDSQKHHKKFPKILAAIVQKICREHPYHGLPVLLTLASSHLDEDLKKNDIKLSPSPSSNLEDRVKTAKLVIAKLKTDDKLGAHIMELEKVYAAYVELSNSENKSNLSSNTASNTRLLTLRNLEYVAALTRPIPVQSSGVYNPPLIVNWDESMDLPGGINQPIKLSFLTSDGIRSNELLKGNDDIRQDAVLQQVFSIVNELLNKDREANELGLCLRTYMAVPLSQKSGLIQWCDNTMTFGSYVISAHTRYNPNDLSPKKCRESLMLAGRSTNNKAQSVLEEMERILCKFKPVFRHFFYEEYPNPSKYFVQQRNYTLSVASSSVVGYVIGLGDRHVQNILIDRSTAQVIHIDLGIAFELGKLLPTPELVPFRLSPDIVDGFGILGVEGPLRKNMEVTTRVLREAKSLIVTIVDVLKHDPLHSWTLSPSQIAKLQEQNLVQLDDDDSSGASQAERAVMRVEQKLNGLEDGFQVLSVKEHVNVLIQQATSINNLSQMFCGWQPYL